MGADFLHDLFSLEGRVALVTGASSGIGRELARGLALAGAQVALSGRSEERLAETRQLIIDGGGQAEIFPAEVGNFEEIGALVEGVARRYGQIDILLNGA